MSSRAHWHQLVSSRFFRLKVGDEVRASLDPNLEHLRSTKVRRVRKVNELLLRYFSTNGQPLGSGKTAARERWQTQCFHIRYGHGLRQKRPTEMGNYASAWLS